MKVSTMKRIFTAILTVLLLVCLSACTKQNEEPTDLPTAAPTERPTDAPTTEELDGYDAIIKRYTELLKTKKENGELPPLADDADGIEKEIYSVVEWASDADRMGYAIKDLDGNGVDELVLLRDDCTLGSLFGLDGDKVVSLEAEGASITVLHRNGYVSGSYKNEERGESGVFFKKINGTSLEGVELLRVNKGERVLWYKIIDGEQIETNEREWNGIYELHPAFTNYTDTLRTTTKTVGLRFVSALGDNGPREDAYDFDASSYDAVLASYKKIVECYANVPQKELYTRWIGGEFDKAFNCESDEEYYLFHELFFAVGRNLPDNFKTVGKNTFGYAKKDIDGNGVEELVLMTDTYSLVAIFTEKDGKALPVSVFNSNYRAWLDDKCVIRHAYEIAGLSEFDVEYSVRIFEGDTLRDDLVIGMAYDPIKLDFVRYKLVDEKRNEVSMVDFLELMKRYKENGDLYESGWEYSKRVSGLEYISLFEKVPATLGECTNSVTVDEFGYLDNMTLNVTEVGEDYILFDLDKVRSFAFSAGEEPPEDEIIFEMEAKGFLKADGCYHFSVGVADGYVEFCGDGAWLVITESDMEELPARVYMMYRPFVYE